MEYLKKYQSILERTSLFGSVPSDELQALLGCLAPRVQQFAANGLIFAEGSPAGQMGLVLHGSVQCTAHFLVETQDEKMCNR